MQPPDFDPESVDYEALAREAEMGYDTSTGDSVGKMLINTTDAAVWAKWFKRQFGDVCPDEATMITWFANAIETGRSAGQSGSVQASLLAEHALGLRNQARSLRHTSSVMNSMADHIESML